MQIVNICIIMQQKKAVLEKNASRGEAHLPRPQVLGASPLLTYVNDLSSGLSDEALQ